MRLLGKEHYSLSLWSWLLQENLYTQGCKNSVLLPAFFFLKPKGPGEIICLWGFHFLHAWLPGASPAVSLATRPSPQGFPFHKSMKTRENWKTQQLEACQRWPRGSTGDSQMLFSSSVLPRVVHGFTGEPPMRVCQGFCVRSWACCAGLTHCTYRRVLTSRWSAVGQIEVCTECV